MYGCGNSIGCLQLSANRIGEGLRVTAEQIDKLNKLRVNAFRIGSELSVTASIVCSTTDVDRKYVSFLVKEGEFILVDGRTFNVRNYGI